VIAIEDEHPLILMLEAGNGSSIYRKRVGRDQNGTVTSLQVAGSGDR
jgi:hypothetical protein